jgi:hypothetical protein
MRLRPLTKLCGFTAVFFLASCSSDPQLAVSLATSSPDPGLRDKKVAQIYAIARRHDEATLLSLGAGITKPLPPRSEQPSEDPVVLEASPNASPEISLGASPSPSSVAPASLAEAPDALAPAIALALFVIDRKRYAGTFVAEYPVDRDGVMNDYGADLTRAHLVATGAAFPVAALGAFALAGDSGAYAKLLRAANVASGSLGATYRAQLRHVVSVAPPAMTFEVLDSLSPADRLGSVTAMSWCRERSDVLLAFRPTAQPAGSASTPNPGATDFAARVRLLQSAIVQSTSADCLAARATVSHRALHRSRLPRVRVRPAPKR